MAKIQLSGLISDISGSVNGSTFQRSRVGHVIRNKPLPRKGNSILQTKTIIFQSEINSNWNSLTFAEQDVWNQFAEFAQVTKHKQFGHVLSGIEVFRMINFYRLMYHESVLLTPVFKPYAIFAADINFISVSTNLILTFNRDLEPTDETLIISVSPPTDEGRSIPPNTVRMLEVTTENSNQINLTSRYEEKFGKLPSPNQYVWIRYTFQSLETGLIGTFSEKIYQVLAA